MMFYRLDRLASVRRAAENQPAAENPLRPALDRLRTEADEALKRPAASVMDKARAGASGDKHDYYSLGSYWWPDPAKPDGLPYIRRDGQRNPEGSQGDGPALGSLLKDAETLALAGFFFRDDRFSRRAAGRLRTWFLDPDTRMNPHLEYGQAIPGICTGRDIGIIDTQALRCLPDLLDLLHGDDSLSGEETAAIREWLGTYLRWLLSSKHGQSEAQQHNNHGTWYDVQVAALALGTGQTGEARRVLEAAPERRFASQIAPDGSQPHELARTLSLSYSAYNLLAMFELATLGEAAGLDLWHWRGDGGRSLRGALDFLAPYADPAKPWQHEQIIDKGRESLLPLLRRGALAFGEAAYDRCFDQHPEHAWQRVQLLWPKADGPR